MNRKPAVSRSQAENWKNNAVQFPRLIAELTATIELTPLQLGSLAAAMNITPAELDELIDRADLVWQDIKERTV